MAKYMPILIGCPHYQTFVRGTYECDSTGTHPVGPDGSFLLEYVRCGHRAGRCAQPLCVLHHLNRRSKGAWHPYGVLACPPKQKEQKPSVSPSGVAGRDGWYA